MKEDSRVQRLALGEVYANFPTENVNPARLQDLPVFHFEELANATNNFQLANKLGQGGFGPVYRVIINSIVVTIFFIMFIIINLCIR